MNLWGVSLWDFAWTYGESLTSKPARGTDRNGWWLDTSDGSGRVSKLNGQLVLDSGRNFRGTGDVGNTWATLRENPAPYGRWETAFRIKRFETGAREYHALLELVPDRASDYRCGTQNITVADIAVGGKTLDIGVRTRQGKQWKATRKINIGTRSAALGIEVSKSHITWFVDGKTVGVVLQQGGRLRRPDDPSPQPDRRRRQGDEPHPGPLRLGARLVAGPRQAVTKGAKLTKRLLRRHLLITPAAAGAPAPAAAASRRTSPRGRRG